MHLPLQFRLDLATGESLTAARESRGPAAPLRIEPFVPGTDDRAAAQLATACQAGDTGGDRLFRPAGIVAELAGRPGREILAWLAWPAAVAAGRVGPTPRGGDRACDCPLGLAALIVPTAGAPSFSIAWLLVHPGARRRGVATWLVATAIAAARETGARHVTAETHPAWAEAVAFWEAMGFHRHAGSGRSGPR
jgi:GNAT superfamily N-acetyltransferase